MIHIERFRSRFAWIAIALLWGDSALLAAVASLNRPDHGVLLIVCGLVLAGVSSLLWWLVGTHWLTRQVASIAAVGQVMLLVYALEAHPYQVDMHMYFFAVLAVLSGWLDWRVFVTATVAIAAHHGGMSMLYSDAVFPGGGDAKRVLVHALIVVIQVSALGWIVVYLRKAFEDFVREQERAELARQATEAAEQQLATVTRQAAVERRTILFAVADDFEKKIAGIARRVLSSVEALRKAAGQMTLGSREVAEGASSASASSRRASTNIVSVSRAAEQLTASVGEIRTQVIETSAIVESTTASAGNVASTVSKLSAKADNIGNVVGLISTIAEQTNLLALNAAIEAARYGATGSGFVVVAQEVKALAQQTSQATERIQREIDAIRASSQNAASAIGTMSGMMVQLNEVSAAVAVVVEQQNEVTADIARTMHLAAQDTLTASGTIGDVDRAAAQAGSAAVLVASSADQLAQDASQLDSEVTHFLKRVRSG